MVQQRGEHLLRGEWVRVRSEVEIAATLDAAGKLEGMPFMPEMARYCGRAFRIFRRPEKTCVEGHKFRRLRGTVLLEDLRCDGAFHDGCQRNCLYFWKEAWLERVDEGAQGKPFTAPPSAWASGLPTREEDRYLCQSTALLGATSPLSRWDVWHLFAEIRASELTLGRLLAVLGRTVLERIHGMLGLRPPGLLVGEERAPSRGDLDLRIGERVAVRPLEEIRRTLDAEGRNRGLSFRPEMVQFAGSSFEVEFPIQRIILEETGRMIQLEHTVALKGVACDGSRTKNCPRNSTLYWREAWLRCQERGEG